MRRVDLCFTGPTSVIGNFTQHHNIGILDLCDWNLHYRDAEALTSIAVHAGFDSGEVRIGHEPEGVNLFLHLRPVEPQRQ
jgi:hypothetical protein